MAKFVVYEKVAEAIYKRVDKSTASSGMQTTINLGSGLIAGFAAAIISQPADTMLSKINKTKGLPGEGTTSRLIKIAGELGLRGSFGGIGPRLLMVGGITAGQFAIYGDIKKVRFVLSRYLRALVNFILGPGSYWRCRDCEISWWLTWQRCGDDDTRTNTTLFEPLQRGKASNYGKVTVLFGFLAYGTGCVFFSSCICVLFCSRSIDFYLSTSDRGRNCNSTRLVRNLAAQ
jgi:hypothetical protein